MKDSEDTAESGEAPVASCLLILLVLIDEGAKWLLGTCCVLRKAPED